MLIISCNIMSFIIFKSFAYSCNLLLCFMSAYTIYLRSGYGKELYVPEGTITVRDSDFYQYDPNGAAIIMLEQFEVVLKSIFDYNFDPVNGIVRENDILTQYTPMS